MTVAPATRKYRTRNILQSKIPSTESRPRALLRTCKCAYVSHSNGISSPTLMHRIVNEFFIEKFGNAKCRRIRRSAFPFESFQNRLQWKTSHFPPPLPPPPHPPLISPSRSTRLSPFTRCIFNVISGVPGGFFRLRRERISAV